MRILLISKKVPFPARDGESVALLSMLEHYRALGWQTDMLCIQTPKHPYLIDQTIRTKYPGTNFTTVRVNNNPHLPGAFINLFSRKPYHVVRFAQSKVAGVLRKILQQNQYHIVQLEGLFLLSYIPIIRKHSQAHLIYRSHNVESTIWFRLADNQMSIWKKQYLKIQAGRLYRYEKQVLTAADAVLAISQADAEQYQAWYPQAKVAWVPAGLTPPLALPAQVQGPNLYHLGALDWQPNLSGLNWFLKDVWPRVHANYPEARFYIAGRQAPPEFHRQLPEGVIFEGEVPDAASFIKDKFICVIPLQAGSGLKLKLVEALMWNKPVVTTPVGIEGVPPELAACCGVAADATQMCHILTEALQNPEPVLRAARKGHELAAQWFSNHAVESLLTALFKKWNWI